MVLFLGAGINFGDKIKLGNNKDIDLSWDGLLHGVFAEAFSLLSIGKDFSSADREILQSLISSKDSQEAAEGFSEKETECLES